MIAEQQMRPKRVPDVTEYNLDDEITIFDFSQSKMHMLNMTAAVVWRLCDGTRTLSQLAEDVAVLYETEALRVEADVRQVVEEFTGAKLVSLTV